MFLILIHSFINTAAGWINLLLVSSSGPVKIPVGAWFVSSLFPDTFSHMIT